MGWRSQSLVLDGCLSAVFQLTTDLYNWNSQTVTSLLQPLLRAALRLELSLALLRCRLEQLYSGKPEDSKCSPGPGSTVIPRLFVWFPFCLICLIFFSVVKEQVHDYLTSVQFFETFGTSKGLIYWTFSVIAPDPSDITCRRILIQGRDAFYEVAHFIETPVKVLVLQFAHFHEELWLLGAVPFSLWIMHLLPPSLWHIFFLFMFLLNLCIFIQPFFCGFIHPHNSS